MIFDKNKKKEKQILKKKKKTCKNKIIYSTPIIVFTCYFGHIS